MLVAICFVGIGCSGGGEEGGNGEVKRIVILTNGTSPFWTSAKIGAEKAAKDFDVAGANLKVEVDTGDFSDKKQIDKLREYQGTTDIVGVGISVTNAGNSKIASELRKLRDKGIKVITIDSDVDRKKDASARVAYVGTNNIYAGEELGKAAAALKPDGGKYATFVGLKGAANAIERIGGFGDGAGAKFESKASLGDGGDSVKARTNVRTAIDNNADLDVLVGIWSYNAPAIVDIVGQLERRDDFTVCCFDAEPIAIKHMENELIDVLAVQNPYRMGYEGVRLLKALVTDDDKTIDEMRGRMSKGSEPDIFDTGLRIVVPDKATALDTAQFGAATERFKLTAFKAWLVERGLTGS